MVIPADVPRGSIRTYKKNLKKITYGTGRLFMFAGDQRVEHLHKDFYGKGIAKEDADPEHFFKIASQAKIGCFASQLGFISRYGRAYPKIPYVVKLNSKTNLIPTKQQDPSSTEWFSVDQVAKFKKQSGLDIVGVGYTVYLGGANESINLKEAAQAAHDAHKHGLVAIFWIYPRGKAVKDEKSEEIIAGATSVASALGADFAKINMPKVKGKNSLKALQRAVTAGGNMATICAGGSSVPVKSFLSQVHDQMHDAGTMGTAVGRNVHQKSLKEAIAFCNAVHALVVEEKTIPQAMRIYNAERK